MQEKQTGNQEHTALLKLKEKFPEEILSVYKFRGDTTVLIKKDNLIEVMQFLRDEPSLQYNQLSSISAIDYLKLSQKERFGIIYHLQSYKYNNRIAIKVLISDDYASIESLYGLWKTADWQEREIYDLFGITFLNHPNLIRIFLPEDFEGHPLRKDYPLKGRNERKKF